MVNPSGGPEIMTLTDWPKITMIHDDDDDDDGGRILRAPKWER